LQQNKNDWRFARDFMLYNPAPICFWIQQSFNGLLIELGTLSATDNTQWFLQAHL